MEDFVSYELAKKLKEKGFNEPCYMYYDEEENLKQNIEYDPMNSGIGIDNLLVRNSCKWAMVDCVCPTISQVLKWLRKEKSIHVEFILWTDGWYYEVWCFEYNENDKEYNTKIEGQSMDYSSYERAALAGIEYALDNLP
jgi:hypothetical protein